MADLRLMGLDKDAPDLQAVRTGDTGVVDGSLEVKESFTLADTTVSDLLDAVDNLTAIRALTGTSGQVIYLKAHTTAGDGGNGEFRWVSGAAPGTYVDNNGTIIVPTGGNGSAAWLRDYKGAISVTWFGAVGDGVTDCTAAFSAAELALPETSDIYETEVGGEIVVPNGTFIIDYFNPTKPNGILRGAGMRATVLKAKSAGSANTVAVITVNNKSRWTLKELTVDGAGIKQYGLGFCYTTTGAGAGLWAVDHVMFVGATEAQVVCGNDSNSPDVASISFTNCAAQGGAYGTSNPTHQILIRGSNTLLISWDGGVIGGGQIPVNIKITGGDLTCRNVQGINSTSYHAEVSGGQFRSYDEHTEGTGGYLRTLSSDSQPVGSAQHLIANGQIVVTGANTSGKAISHEAARQISISTTFFNGDIEMSSTGRMYLAGNTMGANPTTAATAKVINQSSGLIFGPDVDAGLVMGFGKWLRGSSSDSVVYVGSSSTYPWSQDIFGYQELTLLSSADVNGPNRQALLFLARDVTNGGVVLVSYEQNGTPNIIWQSTSAFVTVAPGANEIQVKSRGVGLGVAFRAGSSRNNAKLAVTTMAAN